MSVLGEKQGMLGPKEKFFVKNGGLESSDFDQNTGILYFNPESTKEIVGYKEKFASLDTPMGKQVHALIEELESGNSEVDLNNYPELLAHEKDKGSLMSMLAELTVMENKTASMMEQGETESKAFEENTKGLY